MSNTYQEPVKIMVDVDPSFTKAALNTCLFITKEHKHDGGNTATVLNTFSSSDEVAEYFGNSSVTFKATEYFLGQSTRPSNNPLIPPFFYILSVKADSAVNKSVVLEALNGINANFYAVCSLLDASELAEGDLNSWLNEHRKVLFNDTKTATTTQQHRSARVVSVYNPSLSGGSVQYKAAAYMATVITPGAGSKSDMNIVSMCSADATGGTRQTLTEQNLNFTESRTSKDYVVVRNGVGTDGTDITETTAIDCIIYNLIDNIEIAMAEVGFKQDDRGYSELENVLNNVFTEMYAMGLIADNKGQAEFKVYPINQTPSERKLKVIRPKVLFRLADFAKTVELTLKRTYGVVNGESDN